MKTNITAITQTPSDAITDLSKNGLLPSDFDVIFEIKGIEVLVYNLVNSKSKVVASPKANAKPLIGPIARIYSKTAAEIETKSAIRIVFQASSTALFAAKLKETGKKVYLILKSLLF